jgi:hypothetical protein
MARTPSGRQLLAFRLLPAVSISTAATAAAATSAATTAAAATTGPVLTRLGFGHLHRTAIDFSLMQALNGSLGGGITAHFHEPEPSATAGVAINYHLRTDHLAILGEQLFQVRAGRVEA